MYTSNRAGLRLVWVKGYDMAKMIESVGWQNDRGGGAVMTMISWVEYSKAVGYNLYTPRQSHRPSQKGMTKGLRREAVRFVRSIDWLSVHMHKNKADINVSESLLH
jgi:hypothetical protein